MTKTAEFFETPWIPKDYLPLEEAMIIIGRELSYDLGCPDEQTIYAYADGTIWTDRNYAYQLKEYHLPECPICRSDVNKIKKIMPFSARVSSVLRYLFYRFLSTERDHVKSMQNDEQYPEYVYTDEGVLRNVFLNTHTECGISIRDEENEIKQGLPSSDSNVYEFHRDGTPVTFYRFIGNHAYNRIRWVTEEQYPTVWFLLKGAEDFDPKNPNHVEFASGAYSVANKLLEFYRTHKSNEEEIAALETILQHNPLSVY